MLDDEVAEVTTAGTRFLDWTERRPHNAGAVGVAITKRCFDLGWIERTTRSHAVVVTRLGEVSVGASDRFECKIAAMIDRLSD